MGNGELFIDMKWCSSTVSSFEKELSPQVTED